jgi:hypothetical protein
MTKIVISSPAGGGGGGSGTVTSVALSTGTSGSDVNVSGSPITTSGTLVVNIPLASGSNTGKLSSTDWTTFNNKQSTILVTAPITKVGSTIAITQATTSTDGYLSSTDWNTFNGKQAALVSGTNIKTINGNSILGAGNLVVSVSPAGTTGQVQFNSSGSFGADNDFFWDNTNKRLGIGTATPGTHLDIHSGADNIGTFNRTGSGNSYIQFALTGTNFWRIGYQNSGGNFIVFDVANSLNRFSISNAGVINLHGNTLRNFKASTSTLSSLTVDSSNGATYTGTVFLCSGSSVTIDASVDDGFNLSVIQSTSTQTTISVTGGLTIRNRQGHTATAGQYATVTLLKRGSDLYLGGDTA